MTRTWSIHADAAGRSGEALTPSPDATGRVRLRPPGLGIYFEIAPTLTTTQPHVVAIIIDDVIGEA
jgi:hypothetical protein